MKIYVYIYLMLFFFMLMMGLSIIMFMMDFSIMIEWVIISINSFMLEVLILIDWISLVFMSLVLMISSMVLLYSVGYMKGDKFISRFFLMVIMFIFSMLLMIMSPSLFSILFGWDLLGLVSYCLVIYYQNYYSYNSGMVTVLSNRIGDVGLLITIGLMISWGSWNVYLMTVDKLIIYMMILLASITKSAQMPFSSWLPMAMAAPTPVSSLVHSSTLVTAGVYLIIRYNSLVLLSGLNYWLLYISTFTMIMSGLIALYEYDLKKIIALSTLSQLGLMMMILSMGFNMLGLYHLMIHAVFKSLLFLCAGIIIHLMKGNQDIRGCGGLIEIFPFVGMVFYISILSMMGCPFLAGFYSKDLIMEIMYISEVSMFLLMIVLISLSLTVMYSLRLFFYLFFFKTMMFMSVNLFDENKLMNYSMILLVMLSISSGSLLNWMFFFNFEGIYLNVIIKFLTFMMLLMGVILWIFSVIFKVFYYNKVWIFMLMMWDLNYLYLYINMNSLKLMSGLNLVDSEWLEIFEVSIWSQIKIYFISWFYYSYKVYMLMKFYILIFIMLTLIY